MHQVQEEVVDYLRGIKAANSEEAKKLRFQNLLTRLFGDTADSKAAVNAMAHGGEQTIFNIPRKGVPKTGYADIAYANVIIEWEKDLAKTGKHAEDQLAEYLAGKWVNGERYDYVLIATDGRIWRSYAPDLNILLGQEAPNRTALRQVESFEVKANEEEKFFFFLDRLLFRSQKRRATLDAIQLDFGDASRAFFNTVQVMQKALPPLSEASHVHVAFEQWQRFLQLAYGKFDNRRSVYLVHTYLSVFAKLLAYAVLKPSIAPSDDELQGILSGQSFAALNVEHFVESDFFYWVAEPEFFSKISPALRELYNQICEYDFTDVEEDILKGVYQELIDIDTRHALGEYYTPDWLCERVVAELDLDRNANVLDPACGSGSFLRALVAHFRKRWPDMPAQQIANQVKGIDVHPLSVQIAKTTLLLALGESVARANVPVTLNVYLANTLFLSQDEGNKTMFTTGHHFTVRVDNTKLSIDMAPFIGQPDSFAKAIGLAQHFIETDSELEQTEKQFEQVLRKRLHNTDLEREHVSQLYQVYQAMRQAKLAGRDSIWQFVLQNLYQPVFMYRAFDAIIANPPWLTYSDMTSGDYQDDVRNMAKHYGLMPASKASNPHIDLAALFLSHCGRYLAKDGAQLAFVLPRSFLTANQHHNTRSGAASGFKLTEVWDLDKVSPLFNVPACVLWATASQAEGVDALRHRGLPKNGIAGQVFAGKLPRSHMHWQEALAFVKETPTKWYFQELGDPKGRKKHSALVQQKIQASSGAETGNAYAKQFKQGATIVPRAFYFVQPATQVDTQQNLSNKLLPLHTHPLAIEGAKKPWHDIRLTGAMPGKFLYRTAIARNVLPFAMVNPPLVALPLVIDDVKDAYGATGKKTWRLLSSTELTALGELEAAKWFGAAEKLWEERKSDSAKKGKSSLTDWLNWQTKLTAQPVDAQWAVMYTASASDASACVLDVSATAQRFLAESKCYVCFTKTEAEARFVEAYLNSGYTNKLIKEFQSRGLFGPRDIHKKILELPWPAYNANLPAHRRLVALGQAATAKVQTVLGGQQDLELDPRTLGRLRSRIRGELAELMKQIDALVENISIGQDVRDMALDWQRLLNRQPVPGFTAQESEEMQKFLRDERTLWELRELKVDNDSETGKT